MEVKPGYKQTEVGVIPEDWQVSHLGNIANVGTGGTPSRSEPRLWNGEIPWVTTAEIDFNVIGSTEQSLSLEGLNSSAAKLFPPGTLLLAMYGQGKTRGKVALLGLEAATNQACAAITLNRGVSPRFAFHYLAGQYEHIRALSNTGNQENLNTQIIRSIALPVPVPAEQAAIAAALGDVDALLDGLDRLIAKKRDLKQAAMQQLLTGQTRLPGFSKPWGLKRVDQMGEILAGKALAADGLGTMRPYLRTKNVLDGRIETADVLQMPMSDAEFARFRVLYGDVLLNEGQALDLVGRCAMYRDELAVPCAMQNQLVRFRAGTGTSAAFAEHLFRRCQGHGVFASIATQTTSVAHLGCTRFSSLIMPWPSALAEQEAIATVLSDMDAELAALEARREKTKALKQAMMQELLTGRIRLV